MARQNFRADAGADARALDVAPRRLEELGVVRHRPDTPSDRRGSPGNSSSRRRTPREISRSPSATARISDDAAARAVALALRGVVSRARRQAHAAVHALLQHRVVDGAQRRRHSSRCNAIESKIFPGFSSRGRIDGAA